MSTFTAEMWDTYRSQCGPIWPEVSTAPVLAPIGNQQALAGQTLTFTVSATGGSGTLSYGATGLPSGATFTGQTFSWTPTFSQAGSYSVTFTATDGPAQSTQTITITVVNVNRPPVLAALGNRSVETTKVLSFTVSATDPDGDPLTYSAGPLPGGATFADRTFAWTPTSSQAGTYTVTFTVSDGTLTDAEAVTITVTSVPNDKTAPVVDQRLPVPDAIQVPLNNVIRLHLTDAESGVDANSVTIHVNESLVYQGNMPVYTSPQGRCSRSGTKEDYQFLYQPAAMFDFDETVTVRVTAADLAGNTLGEHTYSFTTEMRAFGRNTSVSTLGGFANSRPKTACDPAGNLWVVWHAGTPGSRDVYIAQRPVGAAGFQTPIRLTTDNRDQCNPALAVSATGAVYVVWQDNRHGHWDLYGRIATTGTSFSQELRITSFDGNETLPALAVDRQAPACAYVAWQDDRDGNQDIYVARSTDGFTISTVARVTSDAADQTEPALAIDGSNTAYLFWTDLRNGSADIYAATGGSTGSWVNVPVVTSAGRQTQPAVAATGTTLHLL